jgi:hypothetical protein
MPIIEPTPTLKNPLFGGQLFYNHNLPILQWALWTGPSTVIQSWDRADGGESFAFLNNNARVWGTLWFHKYPYVDWLYRNDIPGVDFFFPDGTSRPWASIDDAAYANIRSLIEGKRNETWPPGCGAPGT